MQHVYIYVNVYLYKKENENNLIDEHTRTCVAIHEMAHVATKSIGHKQEFWDNLDSEFNWKGI